MITVTPTLHVGTKTETAALEHVSLTYFDDPLEAARAIGDGGRVVVPTLEAAHAVLRARGIIPDSLPAWADVDPDQPLPPPAP